MINFNNVSKFYKTNHRENQVLRNVSFSLHKGEKLGIFGKNGAGKSTLMRLASGAELPSRGKVERTMTVSWPLAFGGAFHLALTGRDNVRFISRVYGLNFDHNLDYVNTFAELGRYIDEPVRFYSSGMRARLAFAISMIIDFDCFLIDEVVAVGDARFQERCHDELFAHRSDRAMIIISHDAAFLRDHCTRFALLDDGCLAMFTEFEEAHGEFRKALGLVSYSKNEARVPLDRNHLIKTSQVRAINDERFQILTKDGDRHRDAANWAQAQASYAQALTLYPYQRSYWVQHGHAAKEQGLFADAEVSYRSACALGEPFLEVHEHLFFVIRKQKDDPNEWLPSSYKQGHAAIQPPAISDVMLFAAILWHQNEIGTKEARDLLRQNQSCDSLLATMIRDPRSAALQKGFVGSNFESMTEETSSKIRMTLSPEWAQALACIAFPTSTGRDTEYISKLITSPTSAWNVIIMENGFQSWPLTSQVIKNVI